MREKVSISTAGFGYIARIHAIALKSMPYCYENFPYNIVLDKLFSTRNIDSEATGYNSVTNNYDEILDSDIVDICTPNYLHREMVERAMAGEAKNIYCEKPLTGIYSEERDISVFAREKGITDGSALVLRFLPSVLRAKSLMDRGIIGEVHSFNFIMYHRSYLDPNRKISWRLEREKSGGGAMVDLGVHMVDLVNLLVGSVKGVRCYTDTVIKERPYASGIKKVDVDDFGHLDLTMENGCRGTVEVSRVAAGAGDKTILDIYGTKGSIKIEAGKGDFPLIFDTNSRPVDYETSCIDKYLEDEMRIVCPGNKYSLGWMVNTHMSSLYSFILRTRGYKFNFIDTPDFDDAAKAMKVIDAGYKSAHEGCGYEVING